MTDTIQKKLKEMFDAGYELGHEHGYELGKRDAEIERLKKEIAEAL